MPRIGFRALSCAALLLLVASPAWPQAIKEGDSFLDGQLLMQTAILDAEQYLLKREPAKAVELLEARLPQVPANRRYLTLLRDAYQSYVNELRFKNQGALAEKYAARLRILEGQPASEKVQQAAAPAKPDTATPGQQLLPSQLPPLSKQESSPSPVTSILAGSILPESSQGTKTRAKVEPLDGSHEAALAVVNPKREQAESLRAQADAEFEKRHYAEARQLYERASEADRTVLQPSHEKWAYSKLYYVVEQVNASAPTASRAELEKEVKAALTLAPHFAALCQHQLSEIDKRLGSAVQTLEARSAVRHLNRNAEGWQVAETEHFRVYHNQPRGLAENVARVAEQTRATMFRKWFGGDGEAWQAKCEIYLHATADEYSRHTKVPSSSPGHSRIETDPSAKRVVSRKIHLHCQNATFLTTVLPHEATHAVLAGQFDGHQVPRWADEGIAVLTEPEEKVAEHQRNLARCLRERDLFAVRELMELSDYPHGQRISAFYAQSVSLVDFLAREKGPVVFARFLRDGLREGYEPALRRHFGIQGYTDLQERWNRSVTAAVLDASNSYAGR